MGKAAARPDRKLQAGLQIEERHRAMLELFADDAFGLETQPVAIETQRPLQVVNPDQ